MRATLPESLDLTFGHEGAYSDAKTDKGNFLNGVLVGTKYGITGRTLAAHLGVSQVTASDVRNLTKAEAEEIYRKSYWGQSGGDLLPVGLDHIVFNAGVMSGPATAVKILQRLLGFTGKAVDGIVGLQTADAAAASGDDIIEEYADAYMDYLRSLKSNKTGFPVNGRGWTRRVTGIDPKGIIAPQLGLVGEALQLAAGVPVAPASTPVDSAKAGPEAGKAGRDPLSWLAGAQPVLGGVLAASPDSGPLPWFIGASMFILAAATVYLLVQRKRSEEA